MEVIGDLVLAKRKLLMMHLSDLEKLQENVDSSSKERAVNTGDKNNIQLYIIGTIASVFIIINSWRKFLRNEKIIDR